MGQEYKKWEIIGRKIVFTIFKPFLWLIDKLNISPNMLTIIGLIFNIIAAIILIAGGEQTDRYELTYVGWAGVMVLFGGLFDMLDGYVAKTKGRTSTFGALFDSVLDRHSELIMFLGFMYFLVAHHYFFSSVVTFFALSGSVMVSYTRARAEGLGIDCSVGFMQRPVRIILIGFSALFTGILNALIGPVNYIQIFGNTIKVETISMLIGPIIIVAIFANYTAIYRLHYSYQVIKDSEKNKKNEN
jgi:CDP-diacylglycerol--glycerol-3-phosphate 3-phosphatidyltransferase